MSENRSTNVFKLFFSLPVLIMVGILVFLWGFVYPQLVAFDKSWNQGPAPGPSPLLFALPILVIMSLIILFGMIALTGVFSSAQRGFFGFSSTLNSDDGGLPLNPGTMPIRYCKSCGSRVEESAVFCGECGASL